jgi:putative ABC transport system permease protein
VIEEERMSGWKSATSLPRDLLLSLRALGQARGFALATVASFALGIGSHGAVFTIVHATLIRDLPFRDPERLVTVWNSFPDRELPRAPLSEAELLDYRRESATLESVAGLLGWRFNLSGVAQPEQLNGAKVSVSLFPLLGVKAEIGRTFVAAEETTGQDRVVLLSHRLWRRRFGGDRAILGRSVILNGDPQVVVGILPDSFRFGPEGVDVWAPLTADAAQFLPRDARAVLAVGRLREGASLAQAQAEMESLARRMEEEHPEVYPAGSGWGIRLVPLREDLVAEARPALLALFAAGGLVLLTALGNVINLMLARATDRRRDVAIRSALGAGPASLARPLVTEAVLLTLAGCALGLLLAAWVVQALVAMAPRGIPRLHEIASDRAFLGLAPGVSLVVGVALGLLATLWALRHGGSEALKDGAVATSGGRQSQRTRSLLVTAQVALAVLVLIGAGLLAQTFLRIRRVDPGFRPDHLLTFQIFLPRSGFSEPAKSAAFFTGLLDDLQSVPGVLGAAAVSDLPFSGSDLAGEVTAEGARAPMPGEGLPTASWRVVTPEYFRTLGIPLAEGRSFNHSDHASAPGVVLVDQLLARRLWPDGEPLHKRLALKDWASSDWLTVVGVVEPVKHDRLTSEPREQLYLPHAQSGRRAMSVVVRTAGDPVGIAPAVRASMDRRAPDLPVANLRTMDDLVAATTADLVFNLWLFGGFSAIAVLLATLGLYSVASYAVARRSREIALRMALGASRSQVVGLVLRQNLLQLLPGLAVGLALSFWATRFLQSQLFEVVPNDPATFAAAPLLIFALGLLASYLPARRAARIEPQTALRRG